MLLGHIPMPKQLLDPRIDRDHTIKHAWVSIGIELEKDLGFHG